MTTIKIKDILFYIPRFILKLPIIGTVIIRIYLPLIKPFPSSRAYWEDRYATGGNSGAGSYGKFAKFKADVINNFIVEHNIKSVIEFGCGDGNQLSLAKYPYYTGFDISETAVSLCKKRYSLDNSKVFKLVREYHGERSDLALSLDVVFHLVEDNVFENHLRLLFEASNRYAIIYSADFDDNSKSLPHIKYRKFTTWIHSYISGWKLIKHIPNIYSEHASFCEFFIYEKVDL